MAKLFKNQNTDAGQSGTVLTCVDLMSSYDWPDALPCELTEAVSCWYLESILRNCFGRNLRIKPNLVKFNFILMAIPGFEIQYIKYMISVLYVYFKCMYVVLVGNFEDVNLLKI
jgi:hypothetical protein